MLITTAATIHLDAGKIKLATDPNAAVRMSLILPDNKRSNGSYTTVTMTRAQTRELRNQLLAMMWPVDEVEDGNDV